MIVITKHKVQSYYLHSHTNTHIYSSAHMLRMSSSKDVAVHLHLHLTWLIRMPMTIASWCNVPRAPLYALGAISPMYMGTSPDVNPESPQIMTLNRLLIAWKCERTCFNVPQYKPMTARPEMTMMCGFHILQRPMSSPPARARILTINMPFILRDRNRKRVAKGDTETGSG